jgi:hypothetical protein
MKYRTVVMLRGHRRPQLLDQTLRRYLALNSSQYPVEISLMLDRPTRQVMEVVDIHRSNISRISLCPFAILSFDGGDRFMEAANWQLANEVEPLEPNWVIFADDDRWPEKSYAEEHGALVSNTDVDCWYMRSLFFWDETRIRTDFFDHNSIFMWRHTPGDRFDDSYNQAPKEIHDSAHREGRTGQITSRLLDRGYGTPDERERCFKAHSETGRLDLVTLHLLDENPVLEEYSGEG